MPIARKNITSIVLGVVLSVLSCTPAWAQQQDFRPPNDPGALPTDQIIVKFKFNTGAFSAAAGAPPSRLQIDRISMLTGQTVRFHRIFQDSYIFQLPSRQPQAVVEALAARIALDPEIEFAEADRRAQIHATPNDTDYNLQWHYYEAIGGVNAPNGWSKANRSNIVIGVIDTGYTNHPDLISRMISTGYDFITLTPEANDGDGRDGDAADPGDWLTAAEAAQPYWAGCSVENSSWHGTHVAGTIGAVTNNASGVAGLNWEARILPLRVLGKCGGFFSDIIDAIEWGSGGFVAGPPANTTPARVLNMSLGGGGACPALLQTAINNAIGRGTVVVVSAGNGNTLASTQAPANCANVITVAAIQREGARASYSNFGTAVEIAAPGGGFNVGSAVFNGVLSTLNSGLTVPATPNYVYYQGTSMAAPHVAGIVSLLLGANPAQTPAQILTLIQATARAFPSGTGRDCSSAVSPTPPTQHCGAGIIDLGAALTSLCGSGICDASLLGPLGARVIVPDGTSLGQTFTGFPEARWFAMMIEPGKTYSVDVLDTNGDLTQNAIGSVSIFNADGTSALLEASTGCGVGTRAAAVDLNADGIRCLVRAAPPNGTTLGKRPAYIKVTRMDAGAGGGSEFRIRARESTQYGRWSTNGYEMHVELQNTTADAMCAEVALYPSNGLTLAGTWTPAIGVFTITVPALGAVKQIIANGTTVGGQTTGTMRIGACASPVDFVPEALHVSTYAYNPLTDKFLYYFMTKANGGDAASSW